MTFASAGTGLVHDHRCPALRVKNLSRVFGERAVLAGVSFSVEAGETLAVTGPSGSGKSVLLKCLNRLIEPSGGTIEVFGTDITHCDPVEIRRRVCLVGQVPVLFPGTVEENLAYPFSFQANRHRPRPEFGAVLEAVGLGRTYLAKDAQTLSGGEAQRVCIARALCLDPGVLLLDEPTSALDRASAEVVEETIRRLSAGGRTIVVVTHDLRQAETLGRRVMRMRGGRVEEIR